jgi:hypothetical protein
MKNLFIGLQAHGYSIGLVPKPDKQLGIALS